MRDCLSIFRFNFKIFKHIFQPPEWQDSSLKYLKYHHQKHILLLQRYVIRLYQLLTYL